MIGGLVSMLTSAVQNARGQGADGTPPAAAGAEATEAPRSGLPSLFAMLLGRVESTDAANASASSPESMETSEPAVDAPPSAEETPDVPIRKRTVLSNLESGTVTRAVPEDGGRTKAEAPVRSMPSSVLAEVPIAKRPFEPSGTRPAADTDVSRPSDTRSAAEADASRLSMSDAPAAPKEPITPGSPPSPGFDRRESEMLEDLDSEFRTRLVRVIERMETEFGHDIRMLEGRRTPERQAELFAQGRSTSGPVVTWTRNSKHLTGKAADLQVNGGWTDLNAYRTLHRVASEEGLRTLGPRDAGHIELPTSEADEAPVRFAPAPRRTRPQRGTRVARAAHPATVAAVAATPARTARVAQVATPGVRSVTPTHAPRPVPVQPAAEAPTPATSAPALPIDADVRITPGSETASNPAPAREARPTVVTEAVARVLEPTEAPTPEPTVRGTPTRESPVEPRPVPTEPVRTEGPRPVLDAETSRDPSARPDPRAVPSVDVPERFAPAVAAADPEVRRTRRTRSVESELPTSRGETVRAAPGFGGELSNAADPATLRPVASTHATTAADAVERVQKVMELQAQASSSARLEVRDLDGQGTRLRMNMIGSSLDAQIDVQDAGTLRRMRDRVDQLHRSLEGHGIEIRNIELRATESRRVPSVGTAYLAASEAAASGGSDTHSSQDGFQRSRTGQDAQNGGQPFGRGRRNRNPQQQNQENH